MVGPCPLTLNLYLSQTGTTRYATTDSPSNIPTMTMYTHTHTLTHTHTQTHIHTHTHTHILTHSHTYPHTHTHTQTREIHSDTITQTVPHKPTHRQSQNICPWYLTMVAVFYRLKNRINHQINQLNLLQRGERHKYSASLEIQNR